MFKCINNWCNPKKQNVMFTKDEVKKMSVLELEELLTTVDLNKIQLQTLYYMHQHILSQAPNTISLNTIQEIASVITVNSSFLLWFVLISCIRNHVLLTKTDIFCFKNILNTIFSDFQLNYLSKEWHTTIFADICWIHCNMELLTNETARILKTMCVKLQKVDANFTSLCILNDTDVILNMQSCNASNAIKLINDNVDKFIVLGNVFWECTYFGNVRIHWLSCSFNLSNQQINHAFDCVISTIKWDTVTNDDYIAFQSLFFEQNFLESSSGSALNAKIKLQSNIHISDKHFLYLLQPQDDFLQKRLPYIHHLVESTPIKFKQTFTLIYGKKSWYLTNLYRLRNIICSSATTQNVSIDIYIYAVNVFYFLWYAESTITFDIDVKEEKNAKYHICAGDIEDFVESFLPPKGFPNYHGKNLIALMKYSLVK